jgi:DNA-binding NtrC family response regulator
MANGGTLFLDEIDKMPPDIQTKVLEVLENGIFHRIGGKDEIKTDVRVLAATNENIEELVEEKSFREELFYRLNVFTIRIPSLRERDEDIPLLAQHFIEEFNLKNDRKIKGLTKKAMNVIKKYSWPGNVRELKNTIERAVVVCQDDFIDLHDLPETLTSKASKTPTIEFRLGQTVAEVEKHFLFHTINHMDGNKTKAAKILGISLKTLHNKLNKYKSSI